MSASGSIRARSLTGIYYLMIGDVCRDNYFLENRKDIIEIQMSLLARNALVLGSERRITPQMGTSGSRKSDGLIKDSSGGLVLPRAMSQKKRM